jgi:hypothetical protein
MTKKVTKSKEKVKEKSKKSIAVPPKVSKMENAFPPEKMKKEKKGK